MLRRDTAFVLFFIFISLPQKILQRLKHALMLLHSLQNHNIYCTASSIAVFVRYGLNGMKRAGVRSKVSRALRLCCERSAHMNKVFERRASLSTFEQFLPQPLLYIIRHEIISRRSFLPHPQGRFQRFCQVFRKDIFENRHFGCKLGYVKSVVLSPSAKAQPTFPAPIILYSYRHHLPVIHTHSFIHAIRFFAGFFWETNQLNNTTISKFYNSA